jgi:carboxypeptidase Q
MPALPTRYWTRRWKASTFTTVRTRHTNADLADAVNVDDLKQSAVVLAMMVWHAAMRDEPIPRRRP